MGAAAEKRYEKLNQHQIDAKLKENERRAAYLFEQELGRLNDTVESQVAEIERLQAELTRAKNAYKRRNAELTCAKEEITGITKSRDFYKKQFISFIEAYKQLEAKYIKLSKIVRLALSPEKYLQYREMVEEN